MSIDISMDDHDWAKLTTSLADAIEVWSERICENNSLGWWYDGIEYDMAKAAIGILKASSDGQKKYKEEE